MAVAKKTLKEKKTAGTGRTGKKTARCGNSSKKTKTRAKAGPEIAAALSQNEDLDGEQILLDAVNREVAYKSENIAQQLANQAAKGNSVTAKLLMSWIKDRKESRKNRTKRAGPTRAEQFAMESDWVEPENASGECASAAGEQENTPVIRS